MHIKHLKHGTGRAAKAAKYITKDSTADVKTVLKGDPQLVAKVADSLKFKHKYSSGVIAWHVNDNPTDDQIMDVLNTYEKMAFAGLNPDEYAFSAVQHREKDGSVHIHTFSARVHLGTGKSYNPAPPGSLKVFDALRDVANEKNGWKRPDDPENARALSKTSYLSKSTVQAKEHITNGLMGMVQTGLIKNRQDVIQTLTNGGFKIARETDKSISIADPNGGKNIRLKGELYERHFNSIETIRAANKGERTEHIQNHEERIRQLERILVKEHSKRAEYNRGRYPIHDAGSVTKIEVQSDVLPNDLHRRNNRGSGFDIDSAIRNYKTSAAGAAAAKTHNPERSISRKLSVGIILNERVRNTINRVARAVERAHDGLRKRFESYYQSAENHYTKELERKPEFERLREMQTRDVDTKRKPSSSPKMGF